jgi:DNA-binding NarL/FixJ family response regulator
LECPTCTLLPELAVFTDLSNSARSSTRISQATSIDSLERPIRILIADDERLFAEAVMIALGTDPRFEVVGHALASREAVDLAAAFQPDVILIDAEMPKLDGFEAARDVRLFAPKAQVVIVNASNQAEGMEDALEAGAVGYISRAQAVEALFQAIHEAAQRQSRTFWPGVHIA